MKIVIYGSLKAEKEILKAQKEYAGRKMRRKLPSFSPFKTY